MNLQNTPKKNYLLFGTTGLIALIVLTLVFSSLSQKNLPVSLNDLSSEEFEMSIDQHEPDSIEIYRKKVQFAICSQLDSASIQAYFLTDNVRNYVYESFINFYKDRGCKPAWIDRKGPLPLSDSLMAALHTAPSEGLHYTNHLKELKEAQAEIAALLNIADLTSVDSIQVNRIVKFDFLMTASYFTYASHLLSGKTDPDQYDITWRAEPRKRNLAPLLKEAVEQNHVGQSLEDVIPTHPQYEQLKKALVQYQNIQDQGGWASVPVSNGSLKMGDKGENVRLLKYRLMLTNDLLYNATDTLPVFDGKVEKAVAHFQHRNGLKADGIAGKNTLALLNTPVEERIKKLRINLERLRWLPDTLGEHHVAVNIPDYKASVMENGRSVLEMKVVVGKEYASTPVFSDKIQYLEFSPTWTVPLSIARRNILPELKKDPAYLSRNNFLLYDNWQQDDMPLDPYQIDWQEITEEDFHYRLVQQPGPGNALGQVKFMFPNDLAIYLHDTPAEHVFDKKVRAYSSGCVRVEKPLELALHLLKNVPEVNRTTIYDYLHLDEPKTVLLPQPVPIQLMYLTAFVDDQGVVQFRKDIYGHDELQSQAL
jgi:murein L,D-transpeptidase YcbB/YkuD